MGTALALAFGVQDASAATRQVGTCTTNPLQYPTIQSAVSAAQNGDTVTVCPGTYPEQVTVTTAISLTNVRGQADPVVAIPAGGAVQNTLELSGFPAAAQILVSGVTASVKNLIVDGTGNNINTCNLDLLGIYFQNAGGTIAGSTAQNQLLPPGTDGCQNGQGIFVESQTAGTAPIAITGNTVDNFDKNGITVSYGAANASIKNNVVTGNGSIDYIAQNGIQLGYGATGVISGNTVSNLVYSPASVGASGILLYDVQAGSDLATPHVIQNHVSNAQYGIVLDAVDGAPGALLPVSQNNVSGAAFAGIGLYSDSSLGLSNDYINVARNTVSGTNPYDDIDACSDNNTIVRNKVSNSAEGGVHLDGLCQEPDNSTTGINNTVTRNMIDDNCVGILSGPPPGANSISQNRFSGNTNNYEYNTDSWSCAAKHASKHRTPLAAIQPLRH